MGEWQIMVTKGEGGEETASVLLPLPCWLTWSGNSATTGLLWIGQDRSESTSNDMNASAYYYNLLPQTSSNLREHDYQKAKIVYVIRGFSTTSGLGDSQRNIVGRSINTMCPEATWLSVRVPTTTSGTGWVYEELMVVMTVRTRDRGQLAGYLTRRHRIPYSQGHTGVVWYNLRARSDNPGIPRGRFGCSYSGTNKVPYHRDIQPQYHNNTVGCSSSTT